MLIFYSFIFFHFIPFTLFHCSCSLCYYFQFIYAPIFSLHKTMILFYYSNHYSQYSHEESVEYIIDSYDVHLSRFLISLFSLLSVASHWLSVIPFRGIALSCVQYVLLQHLSQNSLFVAHFSKKYLLKYFYIIL